MRIRNSAGKLVPIGAFARVERTAGSLTINQLGQLPAVTISFNLPRTSRLGDAVARIDQLKSELKLPRGITTTFAGNAKTFQDSLANQGILLIAAVVTIYIVLGILYESYIHPFTILTGLPSAVGRCAAGAAAVRHGPEPDRGDWAAHADRHRQEERHHDD